MTARVPVEVVRLEPSDKWTHHLLDSVFDGSLWPFPDVSYLVVDDIPDGWPWSIVVVPGEEWAGRVDELNALLERYPAVVLAIVADEGSLFPWRDVAHPDLRLWIQTPRPGVHPPGAARYFGFGCHREVLRLLERGRVDPVRGWFFGGQVNHDRRRELVEVLRGLPGGHLVETRSFGAGYSRPAYVEEILEANWIPCPSGPVCPDSFRFYETLEAARVPVVDGECPGYPDGVTGADYWSLVYGDDFPFAVVGPWEELWDMWADIPGGLEGGAVAASWWQAQKRALAWDLRCDVLGVERTIPLEHAVTVIVTTSPIPSHGSDEILDETLASIRERLPDADVIVAADGWFEGAPCSRQAYREFLERLVFKCAHVWDRVLPLVSPRWVHQANLIRWASEHVHTSAVLVVEHDTPLCGPDIPWDGLLDAIDSGAANVVRFSSEATVLEPWRRLYPEPDRPFEVCGVPMLRTIQWSSRPYLANAGWHRRMLDTYFAPESRTYTEEVLHRVVQYAWRYGGEKGWREWRLWTYAPDLTDLKRSTHLDGRAGTDKGMDRIRYAYPPGPIPYGAPRPTGWTREERESNP